MPTYCVGAAVVVWYGVVWWRGVVWSSKGHFGSKKWHKDTETRRQRNRKSRRLSPKSVCAHDVFGSLLIALLEGYTDSSTVDRGSHLLCGEHLHCLRESLLDMVSLPL